MNITNNSFAWCEETPLGVVMHIKAQPKASKNEVVGLHDDPPRLKVRINAPPIEGKANKELLNFLGELLGIPASRLSFVRGENSKNKDILCREISLEEVKQLLPKQKQMSLFK